VAQTKFDEVLAARRAAKEKEGSDVGQELIAIYGNGSKPHDWYKNNGAQTEASKEPAPPDWAAMDVPKLPEYDRSPGDDQLDGIIKSMPITTAYKRWIGKGEPGRTWDGQTESIMLRCPFPHHVDTHPSAWCNTDKGVWYCDPCDYGGDIYDLAAIRFGFPVPGYKKTPGAFTALRAAMAADFNIQIVKGLNGREYAVQSEDGTTALPQQEAPVPSPRKANGNGVPKGFQIPGLKPLTVAMPGQGAVPSTPPPVAPPVPQVTVPKQTAPPVQPPPVAPPIQPPPMTAPPVAPPKQAEAPKAEETPAAPAEAPPVQPPPTAVPKGFQIPGLRPITIPTGTAPVVPQALVTPPRDIIVPSIQVVNPTDVLLKKYGLSADGSDNGGSDKDISLDWRSITAPESFLGKYMEHLTVDDVPEEFHYFSGLAALSLATGRDLRLLDKRPVVANLFICLMGKTGDGKSDAKRYATDLVRMALPFDQDDPGNKGVKRVSNPASGEYMVKEFEKLLRDPLTNQVIGQAPVRGIVDFEEFATLMHRTSNKGATLAQFMIEFFDAQHEISTGSLTNNKSVAREPFATTFSSTQPEVLNTLVNDSHLKSGFLNRWMFVSGRAKPRVPLGGQELDIEPLVPALQKVFGWTGIQAGSEPLIRWEKPAFKQAYEFLVDVVLPARAADRSGATARIDLMYKKMILLQTVNLQRGSVPPDAVLMANEMYKYLVLTYGVLDQAVNQSDDSELREMVSRAILSVHASKSRPPSAREIVDRLGNRKYTLEQITRLLQAMEKMGLVEEIAPTRGVGRPTVRYQIIGSD
jgi:hypothetical protein